MYARALAKIRAQFRMSSTITRVLDCLSIDIKQVAAKLFYVESISWMNEIKSYGPLTGRIVCPLGCV